MMDDVFLRTPEMPKLKVELNEFGQPVGENASKLSSAIGCEVRKNISIACLDWRLVDENKKLQLWNDIKKYFDIDDAALNWVVRAAWKKWKDFKSTIKDLYYHPDLNIDEVQECPDSRVSDADWKLLCDYWKTSEFQARSKTAKGNRRKKKLHHTCGSMSYACSEYELAKKLGRPPRRDENFIKTHTRKNGVPAAEAEPIINQLKEIVEAQPELKERKIQEGDAFAAVCGRKEPKGFVRVVGLGPTPQDLGTPGLKCYTPTRLKMEILARTKAEGEKAALEQRILQLEAEMEQRAQQDRASEEPMSQHGSTSHHQLEIGYDDAYQSEEDYAYGGGGRYEEDDRNFSAQMQGATTLRPARHITPTLRTNDATSLRPTGHITPTLRTNDAPPSGHDALVGKDVILYALVRSDQPVAKGTIVHTKPSTILAGQALGREFCEVVVTCVLKRDALLPRPYGDIKTMADAKMMPIAWPYKKLKMTSKATIPGNSDNVGRETN